MAFGDMDPAQEFVDKIMLRHKLMNEATERGDSAVQQFYSGAAVFVTGGSGFLGKQLIEKLFRATKISKVFILLRSKKGKGIQERLDEMLQDPVYDLIREQQPKFADKIVPIAGDVAELKLGLSEKDWTMVTEQVDIIFHMAATTRFDEALRVATLINVRGAREGLLLGRACKKLKSYVHVSTAYSHARVNLINTEVLEDFYDSPIDPEALISLAETLDDETLKNITPGLTKDWPNTYSFGKAVAEDIVRTMSKDLPLCIVRPAIVIAACKEPHPGWADMSCVYGATGLLLGAGLGIAHTLMAKSDCQIGLVPVDHVNNAIIAAAHETAAKHTDKPKIYTVSPTRNSVGWGEHTETLNNIVRIKYPTKLAVGYTFGWQANNSIMLWIFSWILHFIPAYIIDGVCLILRKERRFVKLYSKMFKMSLALSYFTVNNWHFVDDNTRDLYDSLSDADKEIFDFDIHKIDWPEMIVTWSIGTRKFIVKDGLKDTKYGILKQKVFKLLTYIIMPLYFYLLFKMLYLPFYIVSSFFKTFL